MKHPRKARVLQVVRETGNPALSYLRGYYKVTLPRKTREREGAELARMYLDKHGGTNGAE